MNNQKGNKEGEEELGLNEELLHKEKLQAQLQQTKRFLDERITAFEAEKDAKSALRNRNIWMMKIAATVLLVGAMAFWFFPSPVFVEQKAVKYTTISSQQTERKKLTLPDGSLVWLNAESQIRYAEDFNHENRTVSLMGEAYFEVSHDEEKPFVVKVGGLKTQVLGTKFNIQAYAADESINVALMSGKIAVSVGENKAVILAPHESIILNKQTQTLGVVMPAETDAAAAWHEGKLIFRDQALETMLQVMERNFGLQVILKNKELKAVKINGEFSLDENPMHMIEELCRLIDARYKKVGSTVTISKTNSN